MQVELIFSIAVLVMSVVIHEVAHGAVAGWLGDPTARLAGRLTLNPLKHLDLFGSIILPGLMAVVGGPVFGWAKPVPYNPHNIRARYGEALVAAAGPLSNIFLAIIFALFLRSGFAVNWFGLPGAELIIGIIFINIVLAIFNLIPIPPLDGSKIIFNFLPYRLRQVEEWFYQYQLVFLIFVIFFAGAILGPIANFIFRLLTGFAI